MSLASVHLRDVYKQTHTHKTDPNKTTEPLTPRCQHSCWGGETADPDWIQCRQVCVCMCCERASNSMCYCLMFTHFQMTTAIYGRESLCVSVCMICCAQCVRITPIELCGVCVWVCCLVLLLRVMLLLLPCAVVFVVVVLATNTVCHLDSGSSAGLAHAYQSHTIRPK